MRGLLLGLTLGCAREASDEPEPDLDDLRDASGAWIATGWIGEPVAGHPTEGYALLPDDFPRPTPAAPTRTWAPARVFPGVRADGEVEVIFLADRSPLGGWRGHPDAPPGAAALRRQRFEAFQRDTRARQDAWLAERGWVARQRGALVDRVRVQLRPGDLTALLADPRVDRIEPVSRFDPDDNAGAALRHATGVAEMLAAGFDGAVGSGRNPRVETTYVAIVDVGDLDADHPAWDDRREIVSVWDAVSGGYVRLPPDAELASDPGNHGSAVATQLFANDTVDRSGLAPAVRWMFVKNERADLGLDEVVLEAVDVVNLSQSCTSCPPCTQDSWAVDAVNRAMLAGILVVSTPGNVGHARGCSTRAPGTASGSLTVNASQVRGDLATADLTEGSARGGDRWGRALIDLVAPGGRQGDNQAEWDDGWRDMGVGTSYAAPLVAAAGADLKHWMNVTWGAVATDHVGLLYAELLLAGDETAALAGGAPDPTWGFGRLHVRPLIPGALAAPWEHRWWVLLIDDGETRELPLSEAPLPAGVGVLEVVAWWHEPNLSDGELPAEIALAACAGDCVDAAVEPGLARLRIEDPEASAWTIRVSGAHVPASTDPWFLPGEPRRKLHVVATWEP